MTIRCRVGQPRYGLNLNPRSIASFLRRSCAMNPSTNAAKRRFPPYQSRDDATSPDRQSRDESETAFISRKGTWHWNVQTDTTVWSEQLYGIVGRENAAIPPFKEHCRFHTSESWIRLV